MRAFIDTSALVAVLDGDDSHHEEAATAWRRLLSSSHRLFTSSYVLVETSALVQHRLGLAAFRALHTDVVPALSVEWVSRGVHDSAVSAVLAARRRRLSLVDCVSFEVMRQLGLSTAFAYDRHFAEQGFALVK